MRRVPLLGIVMALALAAPAHAGVYAKVDAVFKPAGGLEEFVPGPDGNMWGFGDGPSIGRVTPSGQTTLYTTGLVKDIELRDLAPGPDQTLVFTYITRPHSGSDGSTRTSGVGRVTMSGQITLSELPVQPNGDPLEPYGVATGADGNLWIAFSYLNPGGFSQPGLSQVTGIGRLRADGHLTVFPLPQDGLSPVEIVPASDGTLWFTAEGDAGARVGRVAMDGSSKLFGFPGALPRELTNGPDGNAWLVTPRVVGALGALVRITPDGVGTQFPLSSIALVTEVQPSLAAGPDGNLWVTTNAFLARGITKVGVDGKVQSVIEYGFASFSADEDDIADPPSHLAAGPGGIWATVGQGRVVRYGPGEQRALRVSCDLPRRGRGSCSAKRTTSSAAFPTGTIELVDLYRGGRIRATGRLKVTVPGKGRRHVSGLLIEESPTAVAPGTYGIDVTGGRGGTWTVKLRIR
jgi:virginiamycin B lyase